MLNILISCVGKRTDLVSSFKDEVQSDGLIIATDNNTNAMGLKIADKSYHVPPFDSNDYILTLLNICKENSVRYILSLNVSDLIILIKNENHFREIGCNIIGGKIESIISTYDKFALSQLCFNHSLPNIKTELLKEFSIDKKNNFPMIIKPRYGSGSRGVTVISSIDDFYRIQNELSEKSDEYIIQSFISGQEYGLDIINDLRGNFVAVYVRKKSLMKDGETHEAITCSNENWISFAEKISKILKHKGTIDVDVILSDNIPYLIDINYRFGGGYVFSKIAGANTVKAYVQWMKDEKPHEKCFTYKVGIKGQRQNDGNVKILF